jgi:hypothetical protein
MMGSLLDSVPDEMAKRVARLRLAALRETLSEKLGKTMSLLAQRQIKNIVAEIAECREILGPPQYVEREFNAKPGRRGNPLDA